MRKLFIFLLLVLVIAGGYFGFKSSKKLIAQKRGSSVLIQNLRQSDRISPTPVYSVPKTISIPKINVVAPVESIGLDDKKAMDVPKSSDDAGWYDLGVKPGEKGNAVIDGHLDKVTGAPAIFWNIAHLAPGDKIIITDDRGKELTFDVTNIMKYPYNDFPLQKVFGPSDNHMLNLISCIGVWDSKTHNYSQRTVVYSKLE